VPLRELARELGYAVTVGELSGADGVCDPSRHQITISSTLAPNGQVAVLVHELAHALLRVERTDSDPPLTYAQEELVVESIAWSVCGILGLDTAPNSVPYLTAWSTSTDLAILERTAQLINRLANRIEDAIADTKHPTVSDERGTGQRRGEQG
jgi:antirestriction protein ArdC